MTLCQACQDIFSSPRKLAFGSYQPWRQTPDSFRLALQAGCHICNLIEESRTYGPRPTRAFPVNVRYSFKPLNPEWARHGISPKWYAPLESLGELDAHLSRFDEDPTPNKLGTLLATDAENLVQEAADSWLVLEFYGSELIVLPIELSGASDPLDELARTNLQSQTSTGHPETLRLARAWLQNCLNNHPFCQSRPEDWLPTRLLDVGSVGAPSLRLVSGASLDARSPYVALSHRWGINKDFILKSSDVAAYQTAIPSSDVSDTVRDAAEVTRALGIRYLWVDCMCIIQDDGGRDWNHEAEKMSKVYGLSTCTIAAANSGDGNGGIFAERNPYRVRPCRVPNPFNTNSKHSFNIMSQYLNLIYDKGVRCSEWFGRGWVFQERTLASRLLIFSGTQVLWGCSGLQAAEMWPCGKTGEHHIDQVVSIGVEKARLLELLHEDRGIFKSHATWWTFLQDYMSSKLTFRSDRLAAIKGIATSIEDLAGIRYCSGFWLTDDLPKVLLWQLPGSPLRGTARNVKEALQVSGLLVPASFLTSRSGKGVELTAARGGVMWVDIIIKDIECYYQSALASVETVTELRFVRIYTALKKRFNFVLAALIYAVLCTFSMFIYVIYVVLDSLLFMLAILLNETWKRVWESRATHMLASLYQNWKRGRKSLARVEMQRRQREAEARADRVFADLERGMRLDNPSAHADIWTPVLITVSPDFILPRRQIIHVFCLPVLRTNARISGLVLRAVEGTDKQYERLGTFHAATGEIEKLPHPPENEQFLLV